MNLDTVCLLQFQQCNAMAAKERNAITVDNVRVSVLVSSTVSLMYDCHFLSNDILRAIDCFL